MEENLENKMDMEIQAEKLECIFSDEILSKIAGALTYIEKLVLSLYYIENKSDEEKSSKLSFINFKDTLLYSLSVEHSKNIKSGSYSRSRERT